MMSSWFISCTISLCCLNGRSPITGVKVTANTDKDFNDSEHSIFKQTEPLFVQKYIGSITRIVLDILLRMIHWPNQMLNVSRFLFLSNSDDVLLYTILSPLCVQFPIIGSFEH